MPRMLTLVLALLALVAGVLHAPAMAMPGTPGAGGSQAAMEAPCHESEGPEDPAGTAGERKPGCCPDGCEGGCLLAGVETRARALAAPRPKRIALRPRPLPALASAPPDPAFHPPRPLA